MGQDRCEGSGKWNCGVAEDTRPGHPAVLEQSCSLSAIETQLQGGNISYKTPGVTLSQHQAKLLIQKEPIHLAGEEKKKKKVFVQFYKDYRVWAFKGTLARL